LEKRVGMFQQDVPLHYFNNFLWRCPQFGFQGEGVTAPKVCLYDLHGL
jgi:hypothetical protein